LEHRDSPTSLIGQGLNDDRRHPNAPHIERVGSTRREIEDASASVWTPLVDFDDDGVAVVEVWDSATRIGCGLETCGFSLRPLGAIIGGPTVCQQCFSGNYRSPD
jgi:hypothetical protein